MDDADVINVVICVNQGGSTVLMMAANHSLTEIVQMLIALGVDINAKTYRVSHIYQ